MILDIPKAKDFESSALAFLNLACDSVFESLGWEDHFELEKLGRRAIQRHRKSARHAMATALALAQQGIELLIKSKIAAVSPYLLIADNPQRWKAGCDKADIPFSEFRTIDAQDLIKVHDTVHKQRLPKEFPQRFDKLRKLRNSIFHTVDKKLVLAAEEVLFLVVDAVTTLNGQQSWLEMRRQSKLAAADAYDHGDDYSAGVIAQEAAYVADTFSKTDVLRIIGVDQSRRTYLCPSCTRESSEIYGSRECRFSTLEPNTPTSTTVACPICKESFAVCRSKCPKKRCKGNVLSTDYGQCLTCGIDISFGEDGTPALDRRQNRDQVVHLRIPSNE